MTGGGRDHSGALYSGTGSGAKTPARHLCRHLSRDALSQAAMNTLRGSIMANRVDVACRLFPGVIAAPLVLGTFHPPHARASSPHAKVGFRTQCAQPRLSEAHGAGAATCSDMVDVDWMLSHN